MLNRYGIALIVMFLMAAMSLAVASSRFGFLSIYTVVVAGCWTALILGFIWLGLVGAEKIEEKRRRGNRRK